MRTLTFAAVILAFCNVAARADTYDYTLTGTIAQFTYTSPTLIDSSVTFTPTTCTDVLATCSSVSFGIGASDFILISDTDGSSIEFTPSDGVDAALFVPGPAQTFADGRATLQITDIPTSVTPEPSSFALLGTGLLGVAGVLRKRFRVA